MITTNRLFPIIVYLSYCLDQNTDCKETITDVLSILHQEFKVGVDLKYLVATGHTKTYVHLQSLKLDYGNDLSWLIPLPGDWHILKNFQPIPSKVYFDAGLKQLASSVGHRGETLASLQSCSNFKNIHHFLLEVWEAMFIHMYESFLTSNDEALQMHEQVILLCESDVTLTSYLHDKIDNHHCKFHSYIDNMSERDPNWKFWSNFVFSKFFCYISLFTAIRSGNWELHTGSLKLMAPLFCSFIRTTYRKLIPQHLADCLLMPEEVKSSFSISGFSVSISGRSWHSVAIDEANEMLVNKDCKQAVVRPTKEFVNRMALYFPFRSKILHNIKQQLRMHDTILHDCESSEKSINKK